MNVELALSEHQWCVINDHVLPQGATLESAAFVLARPTMEGAAGRLTGIEVLLAQPTDFEEQFGDCLELSDAFRKLLLRRAHEGKASIIEVHSHPGQRIAAFSLADLSGFEQSVPQFLWRLDNRPYAAVVIANRGFDALVWWGGQSPGPVDRLYVGENSHLPTMKTWRWINERRLAV